MATHKKTEVRLRGIWETDFRRSEQSNLDVFKQQPQYPGDLRPGEAFLFVSSMGNQMVFLLHDTEVRGNRVVDSRRWRMCSKQAWSPYMLQDYAEELGLHLKGIKRFAEIHTERMQAKASASTRPSGRRAKPCREQMTFESLSAGPVATPQP